MQINHIIKAVLIILFLFCRPDLSAQTGILIWSDIGTSNSSQGLFIKSAMAGEQIFDKNIIRIGSQFNILNSNKKIFSGFTGSYSRILNIKTIPFEVQGFVLWVMPSEIIYEFDWGILFIKRWEHFQMAFGTNFRTYSFYKSAIVNYSIEDDADNLHENFNVMYSFDYLIKPADNTWNISLSLTDIDCFMINQETNPILNLKGYYKLDSPVKLFAEMWFKVAGFTSMEVNYSGFFFRAGAAWNIH